jgi:FkbM family methyltransferase
MQVFSQVIFISLLTIPCISNVYLLYLRLFQPHTVLIEVNGCRMFVDDRDIGIGVPLIKSGQFDPFETQFIKSLLRPGMTVLDVGSNIGYFTLIAARGVGAGGRVYAFEPQPHNFRLLKKNIEINSQANVTAFNRAMSDKQEKVRLFEDTINYGAHSLSDRNLIGRGGSIEVDAVTIDDLAETVPGKRFDLIKMDTQGAEGWIIEGAKRTMIDTNPRLIIEFWPWGLRNLGTDPLELLGRIRDMGYSIKVIDESSQSIREMTFDEIIAYCDHRDEGWGYYNLYLEKKE